MLVLRCSVMRAHHASRVRVQKQTIIVYWRHIVIERGLGSSLRGGLEHSINPIID